MEITFRSFNVSLCRTFSDARFLVILPVFAIGYHGTRFLLG
jgi:hypothetical protein